MLLCPLLKFCLQPFILKEYDACRLTCPPIGWLVDDATFSSNNILDFTTAQNYVSSRAAAAAPGNLVKLRQNFSPHMIWIKGTATL